MKRKFLCLLLALTLALGLAATAFASPAAPQAANPFVDVKTTDYYYDAVLWAVAKNITSGTDSTHFSPNDACLRAQVVTFLWRAAGKPIVAGTNPFTDVKPTDYYYDAVLWAVKNGITTGVASTHFGPNTSCNRSQVVTFLWRAAGEPMETGTNAFSDVKPTDYYYDAVLWAARNGITTGISSSTFAPFQTCNRAQVVTFLYRADQMPKPNVYTFELRSGDSTGKNGEIAVEGRLYSPGESVFFTADPSFGYLVQFGTEPAGKALELYYLGGNYYELIMPAENVILTAYFTPATGSSHKITINTTKGISFADTLTDSAGNDIAKPGEYIQILIFPDDGYEFSIDNITVTANGRPMEDWWYLGSLEEDPEYGNVAVLEMLMPNADVKMSVTCVPVQ